MNLSKNVLNVRKKRAVVNPVRERPAHSTARAASGRLFSNGVNWIKVCVHERIPDLIRVPSKLQRSFD